MTKLMTLTLATTFLAPLPQSAAAASPEPGLTKSIPAIADASLTNEAVLAPAAITTPFAPPFAPQPQTGGSLATSVSVGQRVRVTAVDAGRFTGTVTGTLVATGERLTVLAEDKSVQEFSAASVTRLEVSQGKNRKTGQGLAMGVVLGGLLGVFAGSEAAAGTDGTYSACTDRVGNASFSRPCTSSEKVALAIGAAASFGVAGAVLGHRKGTERWAEVPTDRIRLSLSPTRGGARAALSFSF